MIKYDICDSSDINALVCSSIRAWHVNCSFPGEIGEKMCIDLKVLESAIEDKYGPSFLDKIIHSLDMDFVLADSIESSLKEGINLTFSRLDKNG